MKATTSFVRTTTKSRTAIPRTDEGDEKNKKALSICTSGKDIYSSVLGPTVDETFLLGLQTFLGFGSNNEDAALRSRLNSVPSRKSVSDIGEEEQSSIFGSVVVGVNGAEGAVVGSVATSDGSTVISSITAGGGGGPGGTPSPKSTKFAPCKYKHPERFMEQGIQAQDVETLPPGYAIKCNKAVACPPKCKVKAQYAGDDGIHVGMTDSIVETEHGFHFSAQTAGPHIGSCGSQTGDLINTSSSQTSKITLTHAPVQTQRRMDSATYSPIPQMSNKQITTSSELLPGLEDCSCSTDSLPAIPIKRKQTHVSQKASLSRCSCGRSCPTLKRRTVKKKVVKVCCNCPSTTTEARTEKSCPSFGCVPGCVGDTNQQGPPTKYAITKITTFSSYTTFEVMKCTRKKPKYIPSSVMGVFVLKNFDSCHC
ncbi:unnamed protein product [Callosobruchus maculatus]|uniref:Uncharacterized protein n=1 Tax=Callosobruchus maculatus TaxID=64391 RepID=A0A653C419_CALMS|nr:unnamed protein product [Callosobruchus maculatus]